LQRSPIVSHLVVRRIKSLTAVGATPIQNDVVVDYFKSFRRELRDFRRAGMYVEYAVALLALEVMVVVPRELKSCGLPWQVDGGDGLLFAQKVQVTVDRCQVQIRHLLLSADKNLLGQQGTPCVEQGTLNGIALFGHAGHGVHLKGSLGTLQLQTHLR